MAVDIWVYRAEVSDVDLTGFRVAAVDGEVGKVDRATNDAGASCLIVDTGPWIIGKKVMLPAGMIESVDVEDGTIYVDRTREEIKQAPEWDPSGYAEQEHRLELDKYYSRFYS
jgi:hypothetical protein